jgi:hypothetical protein
VVLVGTKQLPGAAPTEAEAAEMFADRAKTLELTPTSSQVVAHTPTKLEAEPAVILECTDTRERAGITLVTHNLFLTFFRGNTMVTVTCMVGGPESEAEKIEKAWKAQKPMFQAMFSSIVFEDKWK